MVDRIEELLTSQYNYNFIEKSFTEQEEMSREEKKFVEIMEDSARLEDGHYRFQLPFSAKQPHHCSAPCLWSEEEVSKKCKLS